MGYGVNDNPFGFSLQMSEGAKKLSDEALKIGKEQETIGVSKPKMPNSVFGANVSTPVQNAQNVQDVHSKITEATKNGGIDFVTKAKADAGNNLGVHAGKPVDKDLKPSISTTFDKESNPVSVGIERSYGDKVDFKEGKDIDGSKQYNTTLSDKNGNVIAQNILTENKNGTKNVTSFINEKDKTVSKTARYDQEGKLIEGTTTTKSRDGKEETTVQKKEADGSYSMTTQKPDGTVETAKYNKDGKIIEPKKEEPKGTHKEGSLGDIKEKKADMLDKKKEQVAKQLETGSGRASEKYKELGDKSKEIEGQIAKLDPKKDGEKIKELQSKQSKINDKQSKVVDKVAKKSLAKDENFQKLDDQEKKEQKLVDKYKDFDLTDKEDGHKLTAEEISDKKDKLFDNDGKVLDRKTLAEKGIDKKYTDEAIAQNPMRVFADKNASKEEKTQALVAVVTGNAMGNVPLQRAQGLQGQGTMGVVNAAAGAVTQIALAFTNSNSSSAEAQQVPFTLGSQRGKK